MRSDLHGGMRNLVALLFACRSMVGEGICVMVTCNKPRSIPMNQPAIMFRSCLFRDYMPMLALVGSLGDLSFEEHASTPLCASQRCGQGKSVISWALCFLPGEPC